MWNRARAAASTAIFLQPKRRRHCMGFAQKAEILFRRFGRRSASEDVKGEFQPVFDADRAACNLNRGDPEITLKKRNFCECAERTTIADLQTDRHCNGLLRAVKSQCAFYL